MIDFLCNFLHFYGWHSKPLLREGAHRSARAVPHPSKPAPWPAAHPPAAHACVQCAAFLPGPLQAGLAGSTCFIPVQDSEWEQNGWQNRPRGPRCLERHLQAPRPWAFRARRALPGLPAVVIKLSPPSEAWGDSSLPLPFLLLCKVT